MKLKEVYEKYGNCEIKEDFLKFLKPTNVWDLKCGDEYWYINDMGRIVKTVWQDDQPDFLRRIFTNIFLTETDAWYRYHNLMIRARLLDLGGSEKFGRNNCFVIVFDEDKNSCKINLVDSGNVINDIYFDDYILAEKAIKKIGEEYLKKYWFKLGE